MAKESKKKLPVHFRIGSITVEMTLGVSLIAIGILINILTYLLK